MCAQKSIILTYVDLGLVMVFFDVSSLRWYKLYMYRIGLGETAFSFLKRTRWNCTRKFQRGPGETALSNILFLSENHREHNEQFQWWYWTVQFHLVRISNCECSSTWSSWELLSAVLPCPFQNLRVRFHLVTRS